MIKSTAFISSALSALILAGCTLAPDYQRPTAPVAQTWPVAPSASPATASPPPGWRDFFGDPRLQRLLALAVENNRDLRVAALNVERSRAQYRIQRADLLPALDASAQASRQRTPADLSPTGQATTTSQYSVGLGSTAFELDLFGRVRSLSAAALESYLGTEEARQSAEVALVAQVALQSLTEQSFDEQLVLARQTLELTQSSYEVARAKYDHGTTSELDLRTAEASLQNARSNVATYVRERAQAENALVLLIGCPLPPDLPAPRPLGEQALLALQTGSIPAEVLQQRPDVRQAEHVLRGANANIGAARAAFFPSIALTGSAGTSSAELSNLFTAGSKTWTFAPQITLPLFTAGRNRANVEVSQRDKEIAVARYERTLQSAFREVADALAAKAPLDQQFEAQAARVAAEQQRYRLSDLRYQRGADSYLSLLLARQDLYSAQQALIQTQLSRLSNYISLYQALGGGHLETAQQMGLAAIRKLPVVAGGGDPGALNN